MGLRLVEYFAAEVDRQAAASGSGPYLRTAYLAPFCAIVAAHRKSNDEHIRVTGLITLPAESDARHLRSATMSWQHPQEVYRVLGHAL